MDKLINTQHILFKSDKRTFGTPSDMFMTFQPDTIKCGEDEIMSITLTSFSLFNSQYVLNETNNSFNITKVSTGQTTTLNLPNGNYPYRDLAKNINYLYGDDICSFDRIDNTLVFTFSEPHTLHFNNESYKILGFPNEDQTGTIFRSTYVLNPVPDIQNLCIHIYGVTPFKTYNIDNLQGESMISNLLCVIPYRLNPFDTFYWENTGKQFALYFVEKNIQQFQIRVTDLNGNDIPNLPEWVMTFEIDTFYHDSTGDTSIALLTKILEYTKLSFLSKYTQ
jgi:hypothetical protein